MPSNCVFLFDRSNLVYHSGETVSGSIILTTTSNKSVNAIYILFEGAANVHWRKRHTRTVNGRRMIRIKHFYGREVYVCKRINVFGKGELPAGTHTYAFRVPLPEKCPTSCEGSYGRIAYEVLLVVDRSWRFNNEYKKTVTVLQTYNLNMYPELRVPLKSEDIKYFCCWPCSSGPVISTLTMPFGGYAPGQRIHYVLHIDNQSRGYDLTGIEVSLVQLKVFTATTPHHESRSSTSTYCTTYQAELVRRLSKRIINGSLVIPSVPPSSRNQRAIRLFYHIRMVIKTGICHTDSVIEIPIVIGTIPLAQRAETPKNVATPSGAAAALPSNYDTGRSPQPRVSPGIALEVSTAPGANK